MFPVVVAAIWPILFIVLALELEADTYRCWISDNFQILTKQSQKQASGGSTGNF